MIGVIALLRIFLRLPADGKRPTDTVLTRACTNRQGRLDEALLAAKREIHNVFRLLALANVYYAQGRHAESDVALDEVIETVPDTAAYQIAEAFAYRDDRDQAFAWLDRA